MTAITELHEPTRFLRDRTRLLLSAIDTPVPPWRLLGLVILMSLFVAVSGAFGVGRISSNLRYPLVIVLSLGLSLIGIALAWAAQHLVALKSRPLLKAAVTALTGCGLASLVCWGVARSLEGDHTPGFQNFAGPCTLMMATIAALDLVTRTIGQGNEPSVKKDREAAVALDLTPWKPAASRDVVRIARLAPFEPQAVVAVPGPETALVNPDHLPWTVVQKHERQSAVARLIDRLPHRLRGAAILAVHGEDHFVRVHTSDGEHLIWMRLGDAIEELDGVDGRQTHRSWWVAKTAVVEVRRGNGRAILTLSNGLQAPVSRSFSAELRAEGWY